MLVIYLIGLVWVSVVAVNQPVVVVARAEAELEKVELKESLKWNGANTIRKMIEMAEDRGVAKSTIVLLLLLPIVATIASILHYVIGLSGYGIFMPTMIAVTFLATGLLGGIILLITILLISLLSNFLLRKLKLHFWPARSINLMFISLGTFGLMVASSYWQLADISKISIFPVMLMILLVEEFVRTQLVKSRKEAINLILGTIMLSTVGAMLMSVEGIQLWVLQNPEVTLIFLIAINIVVGNYSGIRWLEIKRFKNAIRKTKKQ